MKRNSLHIEKILGAIIGCVGIVLLVMGPNYIRHHNLHFAFISGVLFIGIGCVSVSFWLMLRKYKATT
jgi:hypothetical protein